MMTIFLILLLLLIGAGMIVVEIFLLPGTTVAGLVGLAFMIWGIAKAFIFSTMLGVAASVFSALLFVVLVWIFMKSKTLTKLSLDAEIGSKIEPLRNVQVQVGDKAVSVSRLAPMGKIRVNNAVVEAKSIDGFVDEAQEVEVVAVEGSTVEVKKIN